MAKKSSGTVKTGKRVRRKKIVLPDYNVTRYTPEQLLADKLVLEALAHDYDRCMSIRLAFDNQLRAFERRSTKIPTLSVFVAYRDQMAALEEVIYAHACMFILRHPVSEWLLGIPGLGVVTALKLLAFIPLVNESDFVTVSKLYKFCGLVPGYNRPVAGQKLCYSRRVKTTLYNFWRAAVTNDTRIRAYDPKLLPDRLYTDVYNNWFQIYTERQQSKPEKERWTPMHCRLAAKNKMMTLFISHLWTVWREALGYPARKHYVHEVLKHQTEYKPYEFSSYALYSKRKQEYEKAINRMLRNEEIAKALEKIGRLDGIIERIPDDNDMEPVNDNGNNVEPEVINAQGLDDDARADGVAIT